MKKLLSIVILFAMSLTLLASCGTVENEPVVTECTHEFIEATCTTPKTCSKCQKTEGDVIAHTIKDGVCPTCGASAFDVMKLWDEEPPRSANTDPVYDYYGKIDYLTMKNADGFCFWSGKSVEFGQEYKLYGVTDPVWEYTATAQLIITKEGIENKTYKWNLIVMKYDADAHANKRMVMTGTVRAAELSKDSVLLVDSFEDPFNLGLTEDKAQEYVSNYAADLVWSSVTGNLATFLSENGEDPTMLGFENYK